MAQEHEDYADNDLPPPWWQSETISALFALFGVILAVRVATLVVRGLLSLVESHSLTWTNSVRPPASTQDLHRSLEFRTSVRPPACFPARQLGRGPRRLQAMASRNASVSRSASG